MFKVICIALVMPCVLAVDLNLDPLWEKYKLEFKKNYDTESEEKSRKDNWESTVKSILIHNLEADLGIHSYKQGLNHFADMTQEEFEKPCLVYKKTDNLTRNYLPSNLSLTKEEIPKSFDWRDRGVVTPVKSQEGCGACWAFATVGAIESAWAIKTGELLDLSEQELIDCSGDYGMNYGCSGGRPEDALRYVKAEGLDTESCYPYEKKDGNCRAKESCKAVRISGFYDVPGDEAKYQEYLLKYGPISVAVAFTYKMKVYSHGIFRDEECKNKPLSHSLLLVGFGEEDGQPYWILKNSHGKSYGYDGYLKLVRGEGMCDFGVVGNVPRID